MDRNTLATELESLNAATRKARRIQGTRQLWFRADGASVQYAGRDKGRGEGCVHARYRHNARTETGEPLWDTLGNTESRAQARMIAAGLAAFYNTQSWKVENYDPDTGARYKVGPKAVCQLTQAARERLVKRDNPDFQSTSDRLATFIRAAKRHSDSASDETAQRDAERAIDVAAPMLRALAARFPLAVTGQRAHDGSSYVSAIDLHDLIATAQSGDKRAARVLKDAGYDVNGKLLGKSAEQVKAEVFASARARVADVADALITEDDLLAALDTMQHSPVDLPPIPDDLFATFA